MTRPELGRALRRAADTWQRLDHSRLMDSIGGLQPKLGLRKTADGEWVLPHGSVPTTHILKPAPRAEWPHLGLDEHICVASALALGVSAARTDYTQFGSRRIRGDWSGVSPNPQAPWQPGTSVHHPSKCSGSSSLYTGSVADEARADSLPSCAAGGASSAALAQFLADPS